MEEELQDYIIVTVITESTGRNNVRLYRLNNKNDLLRALGINSDVYEWCLCLLCYDEVPIRIFKDKVSLQAKDYSEEILIQIAPYKRVNAKTLRILKEEADVLLPLATDDIINSINRFAFHSIYIEELIVIDQVMEKDSADLILSDRGVLVRSVISEWLLPWWQLSQWSISESGNCLTLNRLPCTKDSPMTLWLTYRSVQATLAAELVGEWVGQLCHAVGRLFYTEYVHKDADGSTMWTSPLCMNEFLCDDSQSESL